MSSRNVTRQTSDLTTMDSPKVVMISTCTHSPVASSLGSRKQTHVVQRHGIRMDGEEKSMVQGSSVMVD